MDFNFDKLVDDILIEAEKTSYTVIFDRKRYHTSATSPEQAKTYVLYKLAVARQEKPQLFIYKHKQNAKVIKEDKEKRDRCLRKADQVYGKKTSAYKSGAVVKCRKGKIWKKKK